MVIPLETLLFIWRELKKIFYLIVLITLFFLKFVVFLTYLLVKTLLFGHNYRVDIVHAVIQETVLLL